MSKLDIISLTLALSILFLSMQSGSLTFICADISETREIEHNLTSMPSIYQSLLLSHVRDRCWENGLKMLCFIFVACSLHVKTSV